MIPPLAYMINMAIEAAVAEGAGALTTAKMSAVDLCTICSAGE